MIFTGQRMAKRFEGCFQWFDSAPVELLELMNALNDVDGGASFGARFCKDEAPIVEVESRQRELSRQFRIRLFPLKPPGDHQVDDDVVFVFEFEGDPLADAL